MQSEEFLALVGQTGVLVGAVTTLTGKVDTLTDQLHTVTQNVDKVVKLQENNQFVPTPMPGKGQEIDDGAEDEDAVVKAKKTQNGEAMMEAAREVAREEWGVLANTLAFRVVAAKKGKNTTFNAFPDYKITLTNKSSVKIKDILQEWNAEKGSLKPADFDNFYGVAWRGAHKAAVHQLGVAVKSVAGFTAEVRQKIDDACLAADGKYHTLLSLIKAEVLAVKGIKKENNSVSKPKAQPREKPSISKPAKTSKKRAADEGDDTDENDDTPPPRKSAKRVRKQMSMREFSSDSDLSSLDSE